MVIVLNENPNIPSLIVMNTGAVWERLMTFVAASVIEENMDMMVLGFDSEYHRNHAIKVFGEIEGAFPPNYKPEPRRYGEDLNPGEGDLRVRRFDGSTSPFSFSKFKDCMRGL